MKRILTKIASTQFAINVPESIEEFDAIHGRAGAVLDRAINYDVAHVVLGKIRSAVADYLVKEHGAQRDVAGQNDKGEDILKAVDTKWLAKAFKVAGISTADETAIYQMVADQIGYDVSSTRGGNKEFNQVDLKDAKSILSLIQLGKSTYAKVKANLERKNPGLVVAVGDDGSFTAEQLAAGLKVERARSEAERQAELAAMVEED